MCRWLMSRAKLQSLPPVTGQLCLSAKQIAVRPARPRFCRRQGCATLWCFAAARMDGINKAWRWNSAPELEKTCPFHHFSTTRILTHLRCSRRPHYCARPGGRRACRRWMCRASAFPIRMVTSCTGCKSTGQANPFEGWVGYHTQLDAFTLGGETAGIVGCAVGAPFAAHVAEQLFASGCRLLISLTSAGQIQPAGAPPYFVVIDRVLRDERHQPSLRSAGRVRRSRPPPSSRQRVTRPRLQSCALMSGRPGPRMRRSVKLRKRAKRYSHGRDGSSGTPHLGSCAPCGRAVPCACHEHDGPSG
jgi:Phosphorylase superfamily